MNLLSFSGYSKAELYIELDKAYETRNFERMCHISAELSCTKNEVKLLINHLITIFSSYKISSNIADIEKLLEMITNTVNAPKKNILHNPTFQRGICEITLLIGLIQSKDKLDLLKTNIKYTDSIEPLMYSYGNKEFDSLKSMSSKVSAEVFKLLNINMYLLKKRALKPLMYLTSYLIACKEYSVDEIDFIEISNIKKVNKKEIIWYLWKILLIHSDQVSDKNPDILKYVRVSLELFKLSYKKTERLLRINLLIYSIVVVCNETVKHKAIPVDIIKKASSNIHIVYGEILPQTTLSFKIKENLHESVGKQVQAPFHSQQEGDTNYLSFYTHYDNHNDDIKQIEL